MQSTGEVQWLWYVFPVPSHAPGAHTLITEGKEIPDNSLVMGSPGKVIKPVDAKQEEALEASAQGYVAKAKQFRDSLKEC